MIEFLSRQKRKKTESKHTVSEGFIAKLNKENEDPTVAVNLDVPKEVSKIQKDDKQSFEDFKTMYKTAIDLKCQQDYNTVDDSKLWEDCAKELYLQSKNYIMTGDEYKPKEELDKEIKTESKLNENKTPEEIAEYIFNNCETLTGISISSICRNKEDERGSYINEDKYETLTSKLTSILEKYNISKATMIQIFGYLESMLENCNNSKTESKLNEERYQVRKFTDEYGEFKGQWGAYDTKEDKFVQKGSKKVMQAAVTDLNNKSSKKEDLDIAHYKISQLDKVDGDIDDEYTIKVSNRTKGTETNYLNVHKDMINFLRSYFEKIEVDNDKIEEAKIEERVSKELIDKMDQAKFTDLYYFSEHIDDIEKVIDNCTDKSKIKAYKDILKAARGFASGRTKTEARLGNNTFTDEDEAEYYRNKELYANSGLERHKQAMDKAEKACKEKGIEVDTTQGVYESKQNNIDWSKEPEESRYKELIQKCFDWIEAHISSDDYHNMLDDIGISQTEFDRSIVKPAKYKEVLDKTLYWIIEHTDDEEDTIKRQLGLSQDEINFFGITFDSDLRESYSNDVIKKAVKDNMKRNNGIFTDDSIYDVVEEITGISDIDKMPEEVINKVKSFITTKKGDSKLQEDQYENERRRGVPAVKRIAEQEYYDNEGWYKNHFKDYLDITDFVNKEITGIASEYNLRDTKAEEVCKEIYKLMVDNLDNTKKSEAKEISNKFSKEDVLDYLPIVKSTILNTLKKEKIVAYEPPYDGTLEHNDTVISYALNILNEGSVDIINIQDRLRYALELAFVHYPKIKEDIHIDINKKERNTTDLTIRLFAADVVEVR